MMELEPGIIYQSEERDHEERKKAYHPFIFLENVNEETFIGAMLTTKNNANYENIVLKKKYFLDDPLPSKESFFVPNILIKKMDWSPFKKIGKISQEGVKYILGHLEGTTPEYFEIYAQKFE